MAQNVNLDARYKDDPRSLTVIKIFREMLGRDPTFQDIGRCRLLGPMFIRDYVRSLIQEEAQRGDEIQTGYLIRQAQKKFGVSLVSTYNRQCGIATYTENLYRHLKKKIDSNVLSDMTRDRQEQATEDGVNKCWNISSEMYNDLILGAARSGNKVVHVQHEWGLFKNNDSFAKMLARLREGGFKIILTLHTVTDGRREKFLSPYVDVFIVHNESAASCLYGKGINNVTVISHGTEDPLDISRDSAIEFVKSLAGLKDGEIFCSYPGFISKNKMQLEVMKAARIVADRLPSFRFLMIGSGGIGGYDGGYFQSIQSLETDRVRVVQKFTTKEEMAKILIASDFCVQNYGSTAFSTSGMSHFLMSYGVPSVSSNARILEDLDSSMSIKVGCENVQGFADAMIRLATDPDLRRQFHGSAINRGQRTSWNVIADTHVTVYKSISER